MKLKSLIMFSAAALAFAACSNDEDASMAQGDAKVKVQISTESISRALGTPTEGTMGEERAVVVNKVTLSLSATQGAHEETFTTDESGSALEKANKYVFEGVRLPSTLSVSINDGTQYMAVADVQTGLAAPMYASEAIVEGDYDADTKTYTVELNPQHKSALLEFSGISHLDEGECAFQTITFDGVLMNGYKANENEADLVSYQNWDEANDDTDGLRDAVGADWKTADAVWPATGCYTYNVFPGLPTLTLCYSNITAAPNHVWVDGVIDGAGYATVDEYQLVKNSLTTEQKAAMGANEQGVITEFKAGYVYRFVDLEVPDEAIGNTIIGGEDVKVIAKIQVLPWKLVSGQVTWN